MDYSMEFKQFKPMTELPALINSILDGADRRDIPAALTHGDNLTVSTVQTGGPRDV